MLKPPMPADEPTRIDTLRALNLLDTAPEERFDRLTRLAKRMFGVPISLVSLVDSDRQWFKSAQGLEASETPRDISFCGHAILGDDVFLVPDASQDDRFSDNPLVVNDPQIRFYAGCPLKVCNGSKLGTLCLIDREPREFSAEDLDLLKDLARMAEQEIAAVQLATMDELTMISNRRGFNALGQHTLNVCSRKQMPVSLLLFDLDDFKPINDRFGHAEGDRALVAFAGLLRAVFRESDVFARLGGDEFAALLADTSDEGLDTVLARLAHAVDRYNDESQRGYDLQYSVGRLTCAAGEYSGIDALMDVADARMYEHKKNRKRQRA